jgi:hypothetical protein
MVLDYARAQIEAAQNGGTVMVNGKPVRVRTPYWARRKGSQMDINSNLLEAEADWMLKAHTDIQTGEDAQLDRQERAQYPRAAPPGPSRRTTKPMPKR